jgi:hypothetical protein
MQQHQQPMPRLQRQMLTLLRHLLLVMLLLRLQRRLVLVLVQLMQVTLPAQHLPAPATEAKEGQRVDAATANRAGQSVPSSERRGAQRV